MPRFPRIGGGTVTTLIAGAAIGVPSTLGIVLNSQIQRARRNSFLPRPSYTVDLIVDPPWVSGTPLRIAFLGDSLVEGVGAPTASQSLPAQTAYRLAAHLGRPIHMQGFGVASSRMEHVINEQVPCLTPDHDLVLVLAGANDATHGKAPWEFARQIETLTRMAHQRTGGAPVVFTGIPELESAPLLSRPLRDLAEAMGDTLDAVQRRQAQRLPNARYIDVRCEVGDTLRRKGAQLFAADNYHPNAAGYALMAEGIARSLTALLAEEERTAADESATDQLVQARRRVRTPQLEESAA